MQTSQLKTAELLSFTSEAAWIRCESGQLWISHDGKDIVLARGEKCFVNGEDLIVIEALQDSHFSILNQQTAQPLTEKSSHRSSELAAA